MDNQQAKVTDIEIGWVVGLIDGEGSFFLNGRNHKGDRPHTRKYQITPFIHIVNQSIPILNKLTDILDRLELAYYVQWNESHRRTGQFTRYTWILWVAGFKRIERFLNMFQPYIVGKSKQADVLRDFINSRKEQLKGNSNSSYTEEEIGMIDKIKTLNNTQGQSDVPQRLHARQRVLIS